MTPPYHPPPCHPPPCHPPPCHPPPCQPPPPFQVPPPPCQARLCTAPPRKPPPCIPPPPRPFQAAALGLAERMMTAPNINRMLTSFFIGLYPAYSNVDCRELLRCS